MLKANAQLLLFRRLARIASVIVNASFAGLVLLIAVNEDKPQEAAVPVLYLLGINMTAAFLAWRREKAGAIAMMVGAVGLCIAAYISAQSAGLASFSYLAAGLYGLPFLVLGALFLMSHDARR